MKRLTVGRGDDCDIVIDDERDNVSRHHMVISFNFFGKMKISDTSSNGTSINGTRMLKGTSIPVTRDDTVRLGHNIDFDWNLVKDPYRGLRIVCAVAAVLAVIATAVVCVVAYRAAHRDEEPAVELVMPATETSDTWNKDSTLKVAPVETAITVEGKKGAAPALKSGTKNAQSKKKPKPVHKTSEPEMMKAIDDIHEKSAEADSVAVF